MIATRLSVMMFLQFFIWGAWYVTAPRFLVGIGFEGDDFAWTYSVGPIAGIISPFFVGMIADRFFPTERALGLMHLVGGVAMFAAASMMQVSEPSAALINLLFFGHMLCYYPTLALTNTLALSTMTDPEKQFPLIRVFGTIGWIVAGVVLAVFKWGASVEQFYLVAAAAIALGIYSFTLPHTPPPAAHRAGGRPWRSRGGTSCSASGRIARPRCGTAGGFLPRRGRRGSSVPSCRHSWDAVRFDRSPRHSIRCSFTGRPPMRCSWMMRSRTGGSHEPYHVPSG